MEPTYDQPMLNVEFYTRMQQLQNIQQQRENERMNLEQKFNSYLKSDKQLSKVRANKLQAYWAKLCRDEAHSRARNEQLLRDFDRVDAHVAMLSARTDRLKALKDQYERQIELMHPQWQHQVQLRRRQQLLQQQKEQEQMVQQQRQHQQQQQQHKQPHQQQPHQQQPHQQQQQQQQQQQHHQHHHQQQQKQQQWQQHELTQQQQHCTEPLKQQNHQHQLQQPQIVASTKDANEGYSLLQHASPFRPNSTEPVTRSNDQRYMSIQFGSHSTDLLQRAKGAAPSPHKEFGESWYEVESGRTRELNGSLEQHASGGPTSLELPMYGMEPGRTKFHIGSGTQKSGSRGPTLSYSEVALHDSQFGSDKPRHQPLSRTGHTDDDSVPYQQPQPQHGRIPRGSKRNKSNHPKLMTSDEDDADDDDIKVVTSQSVDNDAYLLPEPRSQNDRRSQNNDVKVDGKAIMTARTDPFTPENEVEMTTGDTAELQDVLQQQLNVNDEEAEEAKEDAARDGELLAVDQGNKQLNDTHKHNGNDQGAVNQQRHGISESGVEINRNISLPLMSGTDNAKQHHASTEKDKVQLAEGQHDSESQSLKTIALTEQGFWKLVSIVEREIDQSDNIEKIYNMPECTWTNKMAIARSINKNKNIDRLGPNAVSMTVLDQLRQITLTMPAGCLLSDKLLSTKRVINQITVRSFLHSSSLSFWDKLLQHLSLLIRRGVMEADEVANMVAPLLVSKDSTMVNKASDVLMSILHDIEEEENEEDCSQFDDTSSSLPSATAATPINSTPHQDRLGGQHQAPPEVPPLDLGGTDGHPTPEIGTDRISHESFFDEEDNNEPVVPLTETKAYQHMMQSGQQEDINEEVISSAEDDEIERAARLSSETLPSSRNKNKRNVFLSFGGEGSLGLSYGGAEDDASRQGGQENDTRRSQESLDIVSSPSPSPSPKESGCIPSGIEQSMKSTGRSDNSAQRSAAFWGEESDMESESGEISVPMGTGTLKSDDFQDDFDFHVHNSTL